MNLNEIKKEIAQLKTRLSSLENILKKKEVVRPTNDPFKQVRNERNGVTESIPEPLPINPYDYKFKKDIFPSPSIPTPWHNPPYGPNYWLNNPPIVATYCQLCGQSAHMNNESCPSFKPYVQYTISCACGVNSYCQCTI